ncbi:MAG: 23S rRNA (guanosine(2251)-2'-O)-methyltransferase RlmB [Egibacteraceae bacterium]
MSPPAGSSQPTTVVPGRRPVAEALRAGRRLREVVVTDPDAVADIVAAAREARVAVRTAKRSVLDELCGGARHQGVIAVAPAFPYVALHEIGEPDLVVVLDGVTDPQNLGAIARSAEAAGAGAMVLPKRRAAHVTPAAEKAAAGAFSWLRVALVPNVVRAIEDLAGRGYWSVGLDSDAPDTVWDSDLLAGRVVLVIGGEGAGLSRLVAERVDARLAIPLGGRVASLNASVAAAVALFEIARRRGG